MDQFTEGFEVLADLTVMRTVLQRLSARGVNFSDATFDEIDHFEDNASDQIVNAPHSDANSEQIIVQETEDIFTQIRVEREQANVEFERGFDEAHAASEMF